MHPFICQFKDNVLNIRDGNHRHEALRRLNIKKYWVLVRTNTEEEFNQLIAFLSLH
ncbi:ParB N-terminal domain-containing protein [Patescibacteria group bacterium]|nr:ParB N-terminal domain-containing protein [Patescibacteria group bacterium]